MLIWLLIWNKLKTKYKNSALCLSEKLVSFCKLRFIHKSVGTHQTTMTKLTLAFSIFLSLSSLAQIKTIKAKFEFNEILNETFRADEQTQKRFTSTLDSINIETLEAYIYALSNAQSDEDYQKAEQILNSNTYLKQLPDRALSLFYNLYYVKQHNLLFNACINPIEEDNNKTEVVYLSTKQHESLKNRIGNINNLEIKLVQHLELTNFSIYTLVDIK